MGVARRLGALAAELDEAAGGAAVQPERAAFGQAGCAAEVVELGNWLRPKVEDGWAKRAGARPAPVAGYRQRRHPVVTPPSRPAGSRLRSLRDRPKTTARQIQNRIDVWRVVTESMNSEPTR